MHIGDITGSLEPGKRADLIVIDTNAVHNAPRFERDPNGVYAQLVYAAKATDVTDVMINGKFVLRSKELLTLDEQELLKQGQEYARKIDTFLIKREKSVYAKLIAIGGAIEEESFEVQAKVKVADRQPVIDALLAKPEIIKVIRKRHYREYDTYFLFDNEEKEKLRYREDHFINDQGEITNVRSRLTHIGQAENTSIQTRYCFHVHASSPLPHRACGSTVNTSNRQLSMKLRKTGCATWWNTRKRNSSSTWMRFSNRLAENLLKSRAVPGARKMPK